MFIPSERSRVSPFIAMDVMARANAMEQGGKKVFHLEIGQPGSRLPKSIRRTVANALEEGKFGYTEALGKSELRGKIAANYSSTYQVSVDSAQIAITTGSSAAFNLAFLAMFEPGDRVALPSPGYPAYRNILQALGIIVVEIETFEKDRWVLTPEALRQAHALSPLKGVLVASPGNPSGTIIQPETLKNLIDVAADLGLWFVSDEIYHGLVYEGTAATAAGQHDNVVVINSFSKYYCLTGWRIGWMVLPVSLVRPVERLAQSFYISAPDISQIAAGAALAATAELEEIKAGYATNRSLLLEALPHMGIEKILPADGAFYIYCDVRKFTNDSSQMAAKVLEEAGVAFTPGADFDLKSGKSYIRLSYAAGTTEFTEAVHRLSEWFQKNG